MSVKEEMYWCKFWARFFATLSIIVPLIAVILMSWFYGNYWYLLGIIFSVLGAFSAFMALQKNYMLIVLAFLFCIGYWIVKGIHFQQYVTFFFICFLIEYYLYGKMTRLQGTWERMYVG